jgi:hypothetical protein
MISPTVDVKTERTWPPDPYKGLTYYGERDVPLFAGREGDITAVSGKIGLGHVRILLLHGMTGCGKSSFLRAGLIPVLEEEIAGYNFLRDEKGVPAFVRSTADPTASLARTVHQFIKREYPSTTESKETPIDLDSATEEFTPVVASMDEAEFVRAVAEDPRILAKTVEQLASRRPRTLVLVIDQAEEIVTLKPEPDADGNAARLQFFDFLSDLSRSRHDLKLIIAFRTEYHGQFYALLRYGADVSRIQDYFLADFTRDQIIEAIVRPTLKEEVPGYREYGIPYDSYRFKYEQGLPGEIADALLNSGVSGGMLPALRIVCRRLYDAAKTEASDAGKKPEQDQSNTASPDISYEATIPVRPLIITERAYTNLGGIAGQVDAYLQNELEAALRAPFASKVRFLGGRKEIFGWRKALTTLVKAQINGTVTTDVIPVETLTKEAADRGCLIKTQDMFDFLADEKRRILRLVAVTNLKSKAVMSCYSLGHDVLASALQAWQERQNLERRALWISRIAYGTYSVLFLAIWLFRGHDFGSYWLVMGSISLFPFIATFVPRLRASLLRSSLQVTSKANKGRKEKEKTVVE